jgi:hypothetical protein
MKVLDIIYAYGHKNISCMHRTTIEITKDYHLTENGDCILAVRASKGCFDLSYSLKNQIWKKNKIKVSLRVGSIEDSFYGFGSDKLKLINESDIVFRKSDYICDRTVLINCNKASDQINRKIITALHNPQTKVELIFASV